MNKIKFIIGKKELRVKASGDTVAIVRRMPEIQSALFDIAASVPGLGKSKSAALVTMAYMQAMKDRGVDLDKVEELILPFLEEKEEEAE